jgi:hypothetical protein
LWHWDFGHQEKSFEDLEIIFPGKKEKRHTIVAVIKSIIAKA